MKISEINLEPVKNDRGLVAFCSFILNDSFYLGSVAIITRPEGGYRLCWPTKKVGSKNFNIVHPINKATTNEIEEKVLNEFKKLRGTAKSEQKA